VDVEEDVAKEVDVAERKLSKRKPALIVAIWLDM
jgi:hypothetical protein